MVLPCRNDFFDVLQNKHDEKYLEVIQRTWVHVGHVKAWRFDLQPFPMVAETRDIQVLPRGVPVVRLGIDGVLQRFDGTSTRFGVELRSEGAVKFFGRSSFLVPGQLQERSRHLRC